MVTKELLEAIRQYDVPTVCNALECFGICSRTDGYISGENIKEIVPVSGGPMIGFAATAKYSTSNPAPKGFVSDEAGYYLHVKETREPTIAVQQDIDKHMVSAIWGQPSRKSPWFASTEPSMPFMPAMRSSCSNVWPASVAWLASMFSLKSLSSPCAFKKPIAVAASKSYWCFIGSLGLGST